MRLRDFLLGKPRKRTPKAFEYDENMSAEQLVDTLNELRAEDMFEQDPIKREELQRQIEELTQMVAAKTDRPKRDAWTDEQRRQYRNNNR